MIKSVYKLDSRIKNVSDIQNPTHYDDSFIGEVCYFANSMSDFEDLESCSKGTLSEYIEDGYNTLGCFTANEFQEDDFFDYFIPEKLLKREKKYRQYTPNEWKNNYNIGQWIHYKHENFEYTLLYLGFKETKEFFEVNIGGRWYNLYELFANFKEDMLSEWQPFGVLES